MKDNTIYSYIVLGLGAAYAAFYLRKIKATKRYVTIIGDSLSLLPGGYQDIIAKKYNMGLDNRSKVGQTSAEALSKFKISNNQANMVFIFLGANDSYSGVNKSSTLDNIKQIQELAKKRGARTVIIPGYLSAKVSNSDQAKRYDDLKESMYLLPGIVIPILRGINAADVPDGVHMTKSAQGQLARLIDIWALRK